DIASTSIWTPFRHRPTPPMAFLRKTSLVVVKGLAQASRPFSRRTPETGGVTTCIFRAKLVPGNHDSSENVLKEGIQRFGTTLGVSTFTSGSDACSKGGQGGKLVGLYRAMPKVDIAPNVKAYNSAIDECSKRRQ
ncbi:unnamed protein product, partial [Pylaiella littoralis]